MLHKEVAEKKAVAERAIAILKKTADKVKAEKSEELQQTVVDEEQQLEIDFVKYKQIELNNKIERDTSIHKWRRCGLIALFVLIVAWLLIICIFLAASGFDPHGYPIIKLSDPVLIALVSTTTINVLMLFLVAARWLYGAPKSDKNR